MSTAEIKSLLDQIDAVRADNEKLEAELSSGGMKVLITGGLGFLGRQLAKLILKKGQITNPVTGSLEKVTSLVLFDLVPVTSKPAGLDDPRVTIKSGDITNRATCMDLVEKDMAVFHLAGIMSGQGEADFDLCMRVNFEGSRNFMEAVRAQGQCGRLIFAATGASFGETDSPTVSDRTKLLPKNSYGVTKAMCEMLINDYSRKAFIDGRAARIPTVLVRPGLPNAATTSCFSGVVREPLNGVDVALPVSGDLPHAVTGARTLVAGLLALYEAPKEKVDAVGIDRCFNMPSISTTLSDIVEALHKVADSSSLIDAAKLGKITYDPDDFLCGIVGGMAIATEFDRALGLGIPNNTSIDDIILQYVEDFGEGQAACVAK
jgi:nucleoside-diphosphate-sugar epimerase